jgi:hypothetical protein
MCSARFAVDLVDQRRERRRLTGAGRAGDEHEAARPLGEDVQARRDAELLERLDLGGIRRKAPPQRAALPVDVDAEARQPGIDVGEVDLAVDLELLLLLRGEDPVEQLLGRSRSGARCPEGLQRPRSRTTGMRADSRCGGRTR